MQKSESENNELRLSRAPLALAWLATVLAIVLALIPAAIFRRAQYDPLVALTAATVIGLAWYTYFTRQGIVEVRTREERGALQSRRAVATAVLAELANTLPRLCEIAHGGDAEGSLAVATLPALEHACGLPELFSPESVLALIEGRRRLRELQSVSSARDEHRRLRLTTEDGAVSKLALINETSAKQRVQFEAGWSYRQLVEVVDRLRAEGGFMPAVAQPSVRLPQGSLPLNPFGSAVQRPNAVTLAVTEAEQEP